MKKIYLFPFNGNSREAVSVIHDINVLEEKWEIAGFIDDAPDALGKSFSGYAVVGNRSVLEKNKDSYVLAVPGRPENFHKRTGIIKSIQNLGNRPTSIIHPSAKIGIGCKFGDNCLIMANVVVTAGITIGDNVIIMPNSVISHDSILEDSVTVGSNVSISGGVRIEKGCYIGTGSRIIQEIVVKEKSLVGLGAVVIKDVPAHAVVAGNPAKIIRRIIS